MGLMHNFLAGIVDIVYPKICHACRKKISSSSADGLVCAECWSKIKVNPPPFCRRCGRNLTLGKNVKNVCINCVKRPLYFDRAFSPCLYDGVIKELIHAFKYKNKEYLAATLAKPMIRFIKEYSLPIQSMDAIVPIPLHKAKLREREFNQALLFSRQISLEFDKPILERILIRHKNTKTQTELTENERFLNLKESFSVTGKDILKDKNILLIDDVLTTGATCSEAALKLKQAGANTVYVLTLAN